MTGPGRTDIPARMGHKAFAAGCAGPELTATERGFFRDARPCGLILFQRNCREPDQLRRLTAAAAEAAGADGFLVLVDQEGGRVRRLRPPHWRELPAARAFGRLYEADPVEGLAAARASARLVAEDLRGVGITVNCAPVLDVPAPDSHPIVGDRAYGSDPETVIAVGRAVAEGYMAGGVVPVIKHVPGHGRARADSHEALPEVTASREELSRADFRPFAALADLPAAMTAHVLFTALDPKRPATVSPTIIGEVIRGLLGFDGLLISDDLSMKALAGSLGERARSAIEAGCDIALHCNGNLTEMQEIAEVVPELAGKRLERFGAVVALTRHREPFDAEAAEELLARAASTTPR